MAGDRRREGDRGFAVTWFLAACAWLALAPFGPRLARALPPCPWRTWLGIPCPGCGTVHAALALGRLDLAGAFAASPLAALGWIVLIGGGLAAGVLVALGIRTPAPTARLGPRGRAVVAGALALHWIYRIARGG